MANSTMAGTEFWSDIIREQYTEYTARGQRINEVATPNNNDAWITSTLAYPIEP